jgi:CDP-diacylglycerol--glycerol-3-phosphate 3-phosphatidyltransferase
VNSPSAIATWANAITVSRILLAPVMFAMIPDVGGSWPAVFVWFLLCSSDFVDGWVARRNGVTRSGAFLDPLADKVLVIGAMFTLVASHVFWIVPVGIIAVREIAVSLYRTAAGTRGFSIPASRLAKGKTFMQQNAVGWALLPLTHDVRWLWNTMLWIAVVLTVWSGLVYFMRARHLLNAIATG